MAQKQVKRLTDQEISELKSYSASIESSITRVNDASNEATASTRNKNAAMRKIAGVPSDVPIEAAGDDSYLIIG